VRIDQTRGGFIETRHRVRAVAVTGDAVCWESGAPTHSPWRSAGKPFQLAVALEALTTAAADLSPALLAIGASSHSGEPRHVAAVRAVLERFDAPEDGLLCGAEDPAHRATADDLLRRGTLPCAIHNDCSGKHAFMLAASRARGWSEEYRTPDHPLQDRVLASVRARTGEVPGVAVDGCGIPTFILSIAGMAQAWAGLARAMTHTPDTDLGHIGWAMAHHPDLVSGTDRIDATFAALAAEPCVGKIGAGGVFCIALPEREMGIAIKVESGDEAALACAIPAVVHAAAPGAIAAPEIWPWHTVLNVVGDPVGKRVVVLTPTA